MLGKHVGSMKGQTAVKALPSEYGMPKLETTGAGEGTLLGQPVQFMATYHAEMQADGSFYGECPSSGVILSQAGAATYRATGAGHPTEDGGSKFRGAVYFSSHSEAFAELNGKACVYSWDVDADGVASWEIHVVD
ncbi:MAG: hypothetical protein CME01_10520 [Geminicoccus sp.]|nr:hypothetical protein [Geminicoccus sp.]